MSDHTMCPGCHQLRYWTDFDARCSQCRQPTPSSGAEMESSPPPKTWAELMDLGIKVQRLEDKLAALEPGPPSPAIMAPSMTPTQEAPSDAELCPICQLPQESGPHRHPMAPVLEPDSPPASTAPATSLLSPWGQPTTPIFLVEPGCACALLSHKPPSILWQSMQIQGKWERVLRVGCPHCDALWAFVQIVAQAAPASPSGST